MQDQAEFYRSLALPIQFTELTIDGQTADEDSKLSRGQRVSHPYFPCPAARWWASDLRAATQYPNIYCKLSGLVTEATWNGWTPADLRPYIETALEAFGPRRCMFGSDWPVCKLAGSYEQVYDALLEVVGDLSQDEQQWILGNTATEFYQLKFEAPPLS